jgi:putative membrane protein
VFAGVVAYVFFGLSEVTEELENPFGTSLNGLPLDAMCRTIERDLLPQIGQEPPAPHAPIDGYLS